MPVSSIEGALDAKTLKVAVVVARFNSFITERLLDGALDALQRTGADTDNVTVVRVPGSWEIPLTVKALGESKEFDAIICLGAVVRGETPHFDVVVNESANGMAKAATDLEIPVVNGVLTTNTMEQAIDRAGGKAGNKGFDAAMTAIEMVNVLRRIRG